MTPPAQSSAARALETPSYAEDYADALLSGLKSQPKRIPCKYFYDAEGSRLFEDICATPEYYPTRTELSLLHRHADEFADLIGPDAEILEFGAGAGEKIRPLLDALDRPRAYLPIDISGSYLRGIAARLRREYPALTIEPIAADFTRGASDSSPARRSGISNPRRRSNFWRGAQNCSKAAGSSSASISSRTRACCTRPIMIAPA